MTGLLALFRRHFAVLTNFILNMVESRPYWPGGGIPRGRVQNQGGLAGPDRPGPQGGFWSLGASERQTPPTPAPVGLPGPAPLGLHLSSSSVPGGWVLPLPYPPTYTSPMDPPVDPQVLYPDSRVVRCTWEHVHMTVLGTP